MDLTIESLFWLLGGIIILIVLYGIATKVYVWCKHRHQPHHQNPSTLYDIDVPILNQAYNI